MSSLALATFLGLVVLLASLVSVELGLSVAILELLGGVIAGNVLGLTSQPWLDFIAAFASIVLTFLAGAEVDVDQLRREWRPSLSIGLVSFIGPFTTAMAVAYWVLGWSGRASAIAGIALSTTSLAVVYAVLVETGLNRERLGKLLMSATFVTDLATATALSVIAQRWFAPASRRPEAGGPGAGAPGARQDGGRGGVRCPACACAPAPDNPER
jgi:Kef-type K+ transport system membrane component KefB